MKPLYIFLHIHKTGGTTFQGHAVKNMKFDEEYIEMSRWADKWREENNRSDPLTRTDTDDLMLLSGHHTKMGYHENFNREGRYFTFVRNPIDHVISRYNMSKYNDKPLQQWYEDEPLDTQSARLEIFKGSLDSWKELLDACWLVGITDTLDRDLSVIFSKLGLPDQYTNYRVAGKDNILPEIGRPNRGPHKKVLAPKDPEARAWLKTVIKDIEWEIYEHALELNSKFHGG